MSLVGARLSGQGGGSSEGEVIEASADVINVKAAPYNAAGDGTTNDLAAIDAAQTAAVAAGKPLYFPPGTYKVGKSAFGAWCIDVAGSNMTWIGVKGQSFIKAADNVAPSSSVALVRVNQKDNITFDSLGFDGNWGNVATVIAPASTNTALPTGTINVRSTSPDGISFPASGTITVLTTAGLQTVTYTGITSTTFTGCTGGTGTMMAGNAVGREDSINGMNQVTQVDPKNYGLFIRGCENVTIDNCIIRNTYGDGIWLGQGGTDFSKFDRNIVITRTRINMTARSGVAAAQMCARIRMRDCEITNTFAQAWDTEPVGPVYGVHDVVIEGNYLGRWWAVQNPARGANIAMTIVGGYSPATSQSDAARNFRVENNLIEGPILIQNAIDVVVENNRIVLDWDGNAYAGIVVSQYDEDIRITNNYIYQRTATWGTCIQVQYYGSGSNNYQPHGVVVERNRIYARNGNNGILVLGTGGHDWLTALTPGVTGTATGISGTTVTHSGAAWTTSQWIGYRVKMGGAFGVIASNTTDTFSVTFWSTPLGDAVPTPSADVYEIFTDGGFVTVDNNYIDCTDDGNGQGALGIVLQADRAGMRVRIRGNEILNADESAIEINTLSRVVNFLEVSENLAWNNQLTPTTTQTVNFVDGNTNITKLIVRGNIAGTNVTYPETGLTSGKWLLEDGTIQRWAGWGIPNSSVTANVGSIYHRRDDGAAAALWLKQTNEGLNTGWVRLTQPNRQQWTIDQGSGIAVPADNTEWTNIINDAGLSITVPTSLWLCQEASGNLTDTFGVRNLTAAGTGRHYNTVVSAWERLALGTSENVAGYWENTDAGLPDMSTGAYTLVLFCRSATQPGGGNTNRAIATLGTGANANAIARIGGSAKTRVTSGANAASSTADAWGSVHPYIIRHNAPGSSTQGFDRNEKMTPTFSGAVTGKRIAFGGLGGVINPPATYILYAFGWESAISNADLKALLQHMGWVINWTP